MNAIIPQPVENQQPRPWQFVLRSLITCPKDLLAFLELDEKAIDWDINDFSLRVSRSYAQRMKKGDPNDPLLKQVLTRKSENLLFNTFSNDPLQEQKVNPTPGLLHKFRSRVLMIFTSSCAIHCRYCFRRHFPYSQNNIGRQWSSILNYIQERPEIEEVILSGGDPLMASNETIGAFLEQLECIQHVKYLRFHTRLPVVIPERIEPSLIKNLSSTRLKIIFVYHINHTNEIVPEIQQGVSLLKQADMTVLNQSVLLSGVNDVAQTLIDLSHALFNAGILPYYINLLDKVQGAHDFDVTLESALLLQQQLRMILPGYLLPRFVKDIPGQLHKIPLDLLKTF